MKFSTYLFKILKALATLTVLTLGACASIGTNNIAPAYFDAFESLKAVIFGQSDNQITRDLVEQIPYASATLKIGKGSTGLVILESVENKRYTWVSADKIYVVVKDGRIIRSLGLFNNLTSYKSPKQTFKQLIEENNHVLDYFAYYSFDEPFLLDLKTQNHLSNRGLENVSILGVERNLYLIEEDISNDYIRWKVKNKFWVDPEDFFVWKSIQYISPKLPEFIFEVTKRPSMQKDL